MFVSAIVFVYLIISNSFCCSKVVAVVQRLLLLFEGGFCCCSKVVVVVQRLLLLFKGCCCCSKVVFVVVGVFLIVVVWNFADEAETRAISRLCVADVQRHNTRAYVIVRRNRRHFVLFWLFRDVMIIVCGENRVSFVVVVVVDGVIRLRNVFVDVVVIFVIVFKVARSERDAAKGLLTQFVDVDDVVVVAFVVVFVVVFVVAVVVLEIQLFVVLIVEVAILVERYVVVEERVEGEGGGGGGNKWGRWREGVVKVETFGTFVVEEMLLLLFT